MHLVGIIHCDKHWRKSLKNSQSSAKERYADKSLQFQCNDWHIIRVLQESR